VAKACARRDAPRGGGSTNWLGFLPGLAHGHAMVSAGGESAEILREVRDGNDGSNPDDVVNGLIHDLSHTMVVHRSRHVCGHDQTSGPNQNVAEHYFSRARDNAH
jgi:hypothetical protein